MAEERENHEHPKPAGRSPAALALLRATSRDKADAYIAAQTTLTKLQAEELQDEILWRHWSLRVRHASDVLKLLFELSLALVFSAIVVALAATVWSATEAEGLVIAPFNVPGHMAATGVSGPVVASKLLDRLAIMQNGTDSVRAASSFTNDWTNDIKVEIPETGVSLGEVVRYLHAWLGHEMHLSGEVTETGKGLAITVRLDSDPGLTFEGGELDQIVRQAAEAVFRRAQPYRFSVYLRGHGRLAESQRVLRELAKNGPRNERAWANLGLALVAADADRNRDALAFVALLQADNPELPNAFGVLYEIAQNQGHDEDALVADQEMLVKARGSGAREWNQSGVGLAKIFVGAVVADMHGDYRAAATGWQAGAAALGSAAAKTTFAFDAIGLHDLGQARAILASIDPDEVPPDTTDAADIAMNGGRVAVAEQDWQGAITEFERVDALTGMSNIRPNFGFSPAAYHRVLTGPWLAYAQDRLGAHDKADAILKTLPLDCYLCTRVRGMIAASRRNWNGATYWFADAVKQAPSIPFAYADWGAMLLHKGDFDGAIAKFAVAHDKGPHFADPLEMWGEALVLKNRSDLALAKFAEAAQYAPNWGRLHLKWGEALHWLGRDSEARAQWELAQTRDLSDGERRELSAIFRSGKEKSSHQGWAING